MIMYSKKDVQYILEDFLAQYFQFSSVSLDERLECLFEEACRGYGVNIENIAEQSNT